MTLCHYHQKARSAPTLFHYLKTYILSVWLPCINPLVHAAVGTVNSASMVSSTWGYMHKGVTNIIFCKCIKSHGVKGPFLCYRIILLMYRTIRILRVWKSIGWYVISKLARLVGSKRIVSILALKNEWSNPYLAVLL